MTLRLSRLEIWTGDLTLFKLLIHLEQFWPEPHVIRGVGHVSTMYAVGRLYWARMIVLIEDNVPYDFKLISFSNMDRRCDVM